MRILSSFLLAISLVITSGVFSGQAMAQASTAYNPYWNKDLKVTTRSHNVGFSNDAQWFTDVTGDGNADYLYNDGGTKDYRILQNQGNGTLSSDDLWAAREHSVASDGAAQWFGDVNGDNKADYIYNDSGTKDYRVIVSNGTTGAADSNWGSREHSVHSDSQWIADVNADGKDDYIYTDKDNDDYNLRVMISSGSGWNTDTKWGQRGHHMGYEWMMDVTDDGQADYVYNEQDTDNYYVLVSNGSSFNSEVLWGARTNDVASDGDAQWLADVTGDGRPDLIYNENGTKDYYVLTNSGSGFTGESNWGERTHSVSYSGESQWFVDLNNDGIDDYLYNHKDTRDYFVMFSTGSYFEEENKFSTRKHSTENGGKAQWFVDINSDSVTDLVYNRNGTNDIRALQTGNRNADTFTMVIVSDDQPYWGDDDDNVSLNGTSIDTMNSILSINNGKWPGCLSLNPNTDIDSPIGAIINGDLTNNFHSDEVDSYEGWYHKNLDMLIFPGLGNHDYANNVGSDKCTTWNPFTWGNSSNECAERAVQYMKDTVTGEDVYYFNQYMVNEFDEDSLAYSFNIGVMHFIQLNNYPTYTASEIDISSAIDWMEADMQAATNRGQRIVLNFHDYGQHMKQNNQQFLDAIAGKNVVALFAGHIHQKFGQQVGDNVSGTNIPFFRSGGVISVNKNSDGDKYSVGKFLLVEFGPDSMNVGVIDYLNSPANFWSITENNGTAVCGDYQSTRWSKEKLINYTANNLATFTYPPILNGD